MRSRLIPPGVTFLERSGIRVYPPALEFGGTRPPRDRSGPQVHRIDMRVANVSKASKSIRLYPPQNAVRFLL